ncbi:MAG TPA: GGDEF domain-containing phosphodiesterase, partial [Nevskiaceae bacterium]|nr:GGDEF domain-containing phosphodiesterase [Nevskiaceae bacterium]
LKHLGGWSPGGLAVLIYIDLRNLRDVNRLASPLEGDRLLKRVEQVLGEWGGGHGVTGRLWSNEFIAAKAIDHTQSAADEAANLRDRLSEIRYASAVGPARISMSMGLSLWREGVDWARTLFEAGEACIEAKRRGLNHICRFGIGSGWAETPKFSPLAVTEFRQLLRNGQLLLHAQPILDITGATNRVAKAEFLIRMERNGVHMPLSAGTIETLEHYGLAAELDRFSSAYLLDWLDNHPDVLDGVDNFSLNLSGASLVDAAFMDALYRDVRNARLPRGKLCFEITETAAIEHLDVAAGTIAAFKDIGCLFSLDDFGSGLCSFGYLDSLAVEEVKIDGRFVRDVAQSPVSQEIVKAIHHVARATGKKTVAEFVDDPRKLEVLKRIGVDYAQGWLFYPAVPTEKLLELLPQASRR